MRKDKRISMISIIFSILGILCLVYFVMIAIYTGMTSNFHYIWIVIGALLLLGGRVIRMQHAGVIHLPRGVSVTVIVLCLICAAVLIWVEGIVVTHGHKTPEPGAKYMIVLGGQVKGSQVSLLLKYRLDAAYDYLEKNEDTIVIVSGGQGTGEDITEAQAMGEYLEKRGIAKERIRREDKSVNTDQNIAFSRKFMDAPTDRVVVVSNAFHIYRAEGICKKQGLTQVEGLGAKSSLLTVPTNYLREALAIIKYKICGQI